MQAHIEAEQNPAVNVREQKLGEFQDAVAQQLPRLYRRAYRYVGDPHDAEDAVQDALLSAYKHLDQYKGAAKITTWLTTIVTNCALTQLRRRPRVSQASLDEQLFEDQDYSMSDRLADARPSPEDDCIRTELHEHIMGFLMELSPALRRTVQLRDLEGLTTSEVGRILGIPDGTVKARMSRARIRLKELMRGMLEGEDHADELCSERKAV
jgi:RNA polymerase sigma-70 factor, ECF subfamily